MRWGPIFAWLEAVRLLMESTLTNSPEGANFDCLSRMAHFPLTTTFVMYFFQLISAILMLKCAAARPDPLPAAALICVLWPAAACSSR